MSRNRASVLHVVQNLDRGAVENWLVRILRHARAKGVEADWTFYCTLGQRGKLDDEVRSLGARIVPSPVPLAQKLEFVRALRAELRLGRYDVLHCHHDLISAIYLTASIGLPIRTRIVHVHNADETVPVAGNVKAGLLRPILRRTCLALADKIVGISQHTLDAFLMGRARRPRRDRVHYYGIDPGPYLAAHGDRVVFRRKLALPEHALILLFAGRMVPEKNPLFAVEVLAEMRRRNPRVTGVFVGAGSLEEAVHQRAEELGVSDGIKLLGWRQDIPEIMSCCDWFILPRPEHPKEGFGIAVVEAQLAGLRLLLSRGILDDPLLPGTVATRLPLAAGVECWAEAANKQLECRAPTRRETALMLSSSPFDLDFAVVDLFDLHQDCSRSKVVM